MQQKWSLDAGTGNMSAHQVHSHGVLFVPGYAETDGGCDDHDSDADDGNCRLRDMWQECEYIGNSVIEQVGRASESE